VAQAVLTREYIEELSLDKPRGLTAAALAEFSRFSQDLLMCDRPANAGDRESDQHQLNDLDAQFACSHFRNEAGMLRNVASRYSHFDRVETCFSTT
jgi:hypothetical protein